MKQCYILSDFINKVTESIEVNNIARINSEYVHKKNEDYVLISDIKTIPKEYLSNDAVMLDSHRYLYSIALPKYDCLFCFVLITNWTIFLL